MTTAECVQRLARLMKVAGDCRLAQKQWWKYPGSETRRSCLDAERRLDAMLAELRDAPQGFLFDDQEGA